MHARLVRSLLLLSFLTATRAAAQSWPAADTVRFSSFVGYQFGWTRTTDATLIVGGTDIPAVYEDRRRGGLAVGARVSVPVTDVFAIPSAKGVRIVGAASFARSAGGYTIVTVADNETGAESAFNTQPRADLWMAKLGLGLRLPVVLPAELTIAPMLVRVAPSRAGSSTLVPGAAVTHAGVNVGVDLDLPLRIPGLSLQIAGEDNVLYANSELAHRVDTYYALTTGSTTTSHLGRKPSHLALLRAGLSVTF